MAPERAFGQPAGGARVPISGTLYQNNTGFGRPPSTMWGPSTPYGASRADESRGS